MLMMLGRTVGCPIVEGARTDAVLFEIECVTIVSTIAGGQTLDWLRDRSSPFSGLHRRM
jgi:hypothetical protein